MTSHVIKLAMCLSVAGKDDLTITKDNLYNAIAKIDEVKGNLDVAFRSVGESSLAVAQDKILRCIEMHGVISRPQLLKMNLRHITDEDLTRVLYVLEYTGFIKTKTENGKFMIHSTDKRYQQTKKGVKANVVSN
jgi:hypothetical protein